MADKNPIFRIFGRDESAEAWASVQRNASSAIGRINGLLPGLGAALTAAGMIAFAKQAFEGAEQLNKLSQRTGIAVEELSALKFTAEQSNVGIEQLALGMKKLQVNAFAAATGSQEQILAFKAIGVSATDANGKLRPTHDLLLDLAGRFSKMEDGAAKTALAVKVFGKAGDELVPFLNLGKDGINRLMIEAQRLGLVMSKESAEAAEKFNDNMRALSSSATALGMALVTTTGPALGRITSAMREALNESRPLMALWLGFQGVVQEVLGMGMKDASEKARDLASELRDLARAQAQLNNAQLSPAARKSEQDIIEARIAAARNELKVLQAQIETERKQTQKNQKVQLDLEQREKDQKAADAFIATLRKEADTYGMSKEANIRYNASKEAAKLQSVDIAKHLRDEAAALAKKIAAQQLEKQMAEETIKRHDDVRNKEIASIKAIIDEATAMEQEAGAWSKSNEERRTATLLQALVKAGIGEETAAYRQLEERLNAAAGKLAYYNELKANKAAREGGLKSLAQEIEDIRFETATLTLNNDQRERAVTLRKLARVDALDTPQGAEQVAAFDEAKDAQGRERRRIKIDQDKQALDQQTAQLLLTLQTEEEAEITSFLARTNAMRQARTQGLINETQYQTAIGRLLRTHVKDQIAIENNKNATIRNMQMGTFQLVSGLFEALPGKSRASAIAIIAINKGLAIAQVVQSTAVAVMRSFAELGPIAGAPFAASMKAIGSLQIGLIAATGLIQAANVGGGGEAVGTFAANPSTGLPESPTGSGFEVPPSPIAQTPVVQTKIVHLHLQSDGGVVSTSWIRDILIPGLREAIGDGVTLDIN